MVGRAVKTHTDGEACSQPECTLPAVSCRKTDWCPTIARPDAGGCSGRGIGMGKAWEGFQGGGGGGGGLADQWPATGVGMITLTSMGPSGRSTGGASMFDKVMAGGVAGVSRLSWSTCIG